MIWWWCLGVLLKRPDVPAALLKAARLRQASEKARDDDAKAVFGRARDIYDRRDWHVPRASGQDVHGHASADDPGKETKMDYNALALASVQPCHRCNPIPPAPPAADCTIFCIPKGWDMIGGTMVETRGGGGDAPGIVRMRAVAMNRERRSIRHE